MPVDPVRDAAIDVLLRVFEQGAYLNRALDVTLRRKQLSARGQRFLSQLVYGTVRHAGLADFVLAKRLHQPFSELPPPIRAILRMGVFQALFCDQVTFPAMVHTAVDLAKKRGHAGTARLVNAVLKRTPESLDLVDFPDRAREPVAYMTARYSLPGWMVEEWIERFGQEEAEAVCAASDTEAPRTVRVNTSVTMAEDLIAAFAKQGVVAESHAVVPEALTIVSGTIPTRGPAFEGGHFFIQDAASMLAGSLMEPQAGDRVLDLCAAPGGKATHMAWLARDKALVVAMDRHQGKVRLVRENAERLRLGSITCVAADGLHAPFGASFNRVLVDAPCTGLGTLRRHPELKSRVGPGDARRLARTQEALLRSAHGLCENDGVIVYSVCTFTREETEDVINGILRDGGLKPEDGPAWLNQWKINTGQYRILPKTGQLDGYFLTRLRKVS